MTSLTQLLEKPGFHHGIILVILINAMVLGLMTIPDLTPQTMEMLQILDHICLAVFCLELLLKLLAQGGSFFRSGWNLFDMIVVGIALIPQSGPFSVLRALRVLRLMEMVEEVPAMRNIINSMFRAIPGTASVVGILVVILYIFAILALTFFRDLQPELFGDLGKTFFTLFQLMTTEGWPSIAREIMTTLPYAWIYFVLFILLTTFTTLNLVVGIVTDCMQEAKEQELCNAMNNQGEEVTNLKQNVRIAAIRHEVKKLNHRSKELNAILDQLLEKHGIHNHSSENQES
ncbi:MAG: ion transporter [Magnetococcales bacterium]|nr:ion transporter [Magnetococcales bacterium]NGZ28541.1 ion transporter [Magnetococcales bacterium]